MRNKQINCPWPSSLTLRFLWLLCHSFSYYCLYSSAFYHLLNSFPEVLPAQLHVSVVMWDLARTVCVWYRAAPNFPTSGDIPLHKRLSQRSNAHSTWAGCHLHKQLLWVQEYWCPLCTSWGGDTVAFPSGRLRSRHFFHKVLFLERESSDHQGGHLPSQHDQLAVFGVCPWLLLFKENLFWNREFFQYHLPSLVP